MLYMDGGHTKMDNLAIARALGYYIEKTRTGRLAVRPPHPLYMDLPSTGHRVILPDFLGSLDVIVKEIEDRKLTWSVSTDGTIKAGLMDPGRPEWTGLWVHGCRSGSEGLACVLMSHLGRGPITSEAMGGQQNGTK